MRLWILALQIGLAVPAAAQDARDSPADELIHSDLPLFGDAKGETWPRGITGNEPGLSGNEIGCVSRAAFGIWKYTVAGKSNDYALWYRVARYSYFDCGALISFSLKRDQIMQAPAQFGYFVLMSKTKDNELWALQTGTMPGSDYLLLARKPGASSDAPFDILQRDCPQSMRRGPGLPRNMLTSYCAINSRSDLITLARAMAKRPPLGSFAWVGREDEGRKADN